MAQFGEPAAQNREQRDAQPSEFRAPPPPPQHVNAPEPTGSDEPRPQHSEHTEAKPAAAHFEPTPRAAPAAPAPTVGGESSGGAAKPFVVWSSAPSRDSGRDPE
jgi:hypothetical protein